MCEPVCRASSQPSRCRARSNSVADNRGSFGLTCHSRRRSRRWAARFIVSIPAFAGFPVLPRRSSSAHARSFSVIGWSAKISSRTRSRSSFSGFASISIVSPISRFFSMILPSPRREVVRRALPGRRHPSVFGETTVWVPMRPSKVTIETGTWYSVSQDDSRRRRAFRSRASPRKLP